MSCSLSAGGAGTAPKMPTRPPGTFAHLLPTNGAAMHDWGLLRTPCAGDRVAGPFHAVQGDRSGTCVDWQAFHSWQADDPGFRALGLNPWTNPALTVAPDDPRRTDPRR
jgi:hypothetical protein